jgi:Leishmanolysin
MSSRLYPLFRFKDGAISPRTPRDPHYPDRPAAEFLHSYTCGGKAYQQYLPAENTLGVFSERGMYCTRRNATADGNCVMRMITPALREASRTFFYCASLPGPEIENTETGSCSLLSSHFESRTLLFDAMIPFLSDLDQGFSIVSLAMYDDSGWYAVDYTKASGAWYGTSFGYQQGCYFASYDRCILDYGGSFQQGTGSPLHYWPAPHTATQGQCRLDRLGYGFVDLRVWDETLHPWFRYFGTKLLGGHLPGLDYCPVMFAQEVPGVPGGLCSNAIPTGSMSANDKDRAMHYGLDSLCFETSLSLTGRTAASAGCYKYACDGEGYSARLNITVVDPYTPTETLTKQCLPYGAGTRLSFPGYDGSIVCPDPQHICFSRSTALKADIQAMSLTAIAIEQGTAPASSGSGPTGGPDGGSKLSIGQIAGVAVIAIGTILVATVGAFRFVIHRRRRSSSSVTAAAAPTSSVELPPVAVVAT